MKERRSESLGQSIAISRDIFFNITGNDILTLRGIFCDIPSKM